MKILVVSNYYPPLHIGGYELGCHEVMQALKARGHQVKVLTSTYRVDRPEDDGDVYRVLGETYLTAGERQLLRLEAAGQKAFARLCRSFRPDVVYFWNMAGIPISLIFAAERRRLPFCLFVSDHWLSEWRQDKWYALTHWRPASVRGRLLWSAIRRALRWGGLILPDGQFAVSHAQFCSQYLKEAALKADLPVAQADVIHWGTRAALAQLGPPKAPRRLLYAGQVMPHKGTHTAVEALDLLAQAGYDGVTLTVAGGSVNPDYEASVHRLAAERGLTGRCRFTGPLPRGELFALYPDHDILVFPSVWEEPFAITPLEAMASGLAVVGTTTGGSGEIFEDGVNALTFPKEDAATCARQVRRLLDDAALFDAIRRRGQQTVRDRFRFEMMVGRIETALREAVAA